jgi:hypothetical protein
VWSKLLMHTHSPNKPKKFKQKLSVLQKADCRCFLGQARSSDGGIHATRDDSNVRSVLRNTKRACLGPVIQNKRREMLTSSVVLLHDSAHSHTDAPNPALLEHYNWELFDHPPNSPDLPSSDHHLSTYLRNWLESRCFNNDELMKGVQTWLIL